MRHTFASAWVGLVAAGAIGQSVNVRFGTAATTPSTSYAAAGLPGFWNSFEVTPGYAQQPLRSLYGSPLSAVYYQYGNSSMLAHNNPLTSGDDERLMDSMMLSTNSPVDGCFWVQGLMLGPYEVTIYAMTPNSASLLSRTRVDNGTPGPVMVGGAWPGQHQQGTTYAKFNVTTNDGTIAFHDGLYGGVLQSGMNGVQLKFLGPCAPPSFSTQPAPASTCPNGSAAFSVAVAGAAPLTYQWQLQTAPGSWNTLGNDPMPLPCGGWAYANPPTAAATSIGIAACAGVTSYQLRCVATNPCGVTASNEVTYTICYANCDCSTASPSLNVQDFSCFLNAFANGSAYANCDGSTATPVLNVQDFACFLNAFASGCP